MLKTKAKSGIKNYSGAEETRTLYLIAARVEHPILRVCVDSPCLKEKAKKRPCLLDFLCFACQLVVVNGHEASVSFGKNIAENVHKMSIEFSSYYIYVNDLQPRFSPSLPPGSQTVSPFLLRPGSQAV